jgi:ribosomal-protein-alanine N-acetyltransferase
LLARAGFQQEGYAREYLCIAGKWQDHLLFGILRGDRSAPQIKVGELKPEN